VEEEARAVARAASHTELEAEERPWEVAGAGGFQLLEPPPAPWREPRRAPRDSPAPVARLADAPFESPLPEESEEDRAVRSLVASLPGVSPKSRRLDVGSRPAVWVPPELEAEELPQMLSREDVLDVLLGRKDELVECVREQQAEVPELHGTLTMRWRIQPEGTTTGIVVESPGLRGTELARCARERIAAWTFPAHRQRMGPVRVPFTF
jgi:hypothetical protein